MILGWDIGAANIKAALWQRQEDCRGKLKVASKPFEIWRSKEDLPRVLQSVLFYLCGGTFSDVMAVTMTAELSDVFLTKRDGVLFVLDSLKSAFPENLIYIFSLSGRFVELSAAVRCPLEFAASNWMATAKWVAEQIPNCLLVDVGSTTTDILPVVDGRVAVTGRSDLERLVSGELVYTGALRTNLAAISRAVPVEGRLCPVASEYFAISADVHLILGNLSADAYSCPTPDGQPASIGSARRRVARLVCADTESLSPDQIDEIARYLESSQVLLIKDGIEQVLSRLPRLRNFPALVFGSGNFLGRAAAVLSGLSIATMPLNETSSAVVPCLAAAQLLDQQLEAGVV